MGEQEPDESDLVELDPEPTFAGRLARWTERVRVLREQIDAARERHPSVDLGFEVIERDSTIGGGMLAGALSYRLFVFLLPLTLFLVSGIGVYADTTGKPASEVAADSGLTGLIASQVTSAATSSARWAIFIVTVPVLVYVTAMLYRATSIVHAIAWLGSGRGVKITPRGLGLFSVFLIAVLVCAAIVGRIRHSDQAGGIAALVVYTGVLGAMWVVMARQLPHRAVPWTGFVPGAALFSVGMLLVNSFNVYVTTRLVEERENTYGALGVAAALLFSLYLVGRLVVGSAVLNATLADRRARASR